MINKKKLLKEHNKKMEANLVREFTVESGAFCEEKPTCILNLKSYFLIKLSSQKYKQKNGIDTFRNLY